MSLLSDIQPGQWHHSIICLQSRVCESGGIYKSGIKLQTFSSISKTIKKSNANCVNSSFSPLAPVDWIVSVGTWTASSLFCLKGSAWTEWCLICSLRWNVIIRKYKYTHCYQSEASTVCLSIIIYHLIWMMCIIRENGALRRHRDQPLSSWCMILNTEYDISLYSYIYVRIIVAFILNGWMNADYIEHCC